MSMPLRHSVWMAEQGVYLVITAFAALVLYGCTTASVARDDPLIEKIVDVAEAEFISQRELATRIAEADVIYLGEKHDNDRHHEIQSQLIQQLFDSGKSPAIGFEFFSIEQSGYLLEYTRGSTSTLMMKPTASPEDILRERVGWGRDRDVDWNRYGPLLKLARENESAAFGMDAPGAVRLRLSRSGLDGLTRLEQLLLHPTGLDDPDYEQLMIEKLEQVHCGYSSEELNKKLYDTWVARNDTMATAISQMLEAKAGHPIVVIVGGGHVEHNQGVYERVAHLNPGVKQINLGLTEISREPAELNEYLEGVVVGDRQFAPYHEYLWFTQRVDYLDPCEQFHRR